LKTTDIDYSVGGTKYIGYLAVDYARAGKRPGVLVCHEGNGLHPEVKVRCQRLAELGYVAFALDYHGGGVPLPLEEAMPKLGELMADPAATRRRGLAGLDVLLAQSVTDADRVAAIGYCFGGTTALEVARSGAEIVGAISFHGDLSSPAPDDAKKIKGKVLALHGADDPFVPAPQVSAFEEEMRKAGVDIRVRADVAGIEAAGSDYAGNDNSTGSAYNEKADLRSWEAYRGFLAEIFK